MFPLKGNSFQHFPIFRVVNPRDLLIFVNRSDSAAIGGADNFCTRFSGPKFPLFRQIISPDSPLSRIDNAVFIQKNHVGKRGFFHIQYGKPL